MSLLATRLQNFRDDNPNYDKWEHRAKKAGFLDLHVKQNNDPESIVSPQTVQKALDSVGSTLEIPVLNFDSGVQVTNETLRLTTPYSGNTSALETITFVHIYFGFGIYPALHKNNEISMQRDFDRKMKKHLIEVRNQLNDLGRDNCENNKSQVLQDDLGGRYSFTSNVVLAPLGEQDSYIGDTSLLMSENDFDVDEIDIVANASTESIIRNRLMEQNEFNQRDKRYQWLDKNFYFTSNLSNDVGNKATMFALMPGSVGLVQQFQPDCLMGHSTADGHIWDIENLPMLNMPFGTYYYEGAYDATAVGGASTAHLTATKGQWFAFHSAFAFMRAYNSDRATIPGSILKVALQNS